MADDNILGDWLIEQLDALGLSQAEFARRAGVHKSVINKICCRLVVKPDITTYAAIAKALDVPLVTVLRKAGFVPPNLELPELDDFVHVIRKMSPEQRALGLDLLRTVLESGSQRKGADRG